MSGLAPMRWLSDAAGTLMADWRVPGLLNHTDPYLVWLDLSGARGAALPQGLLPVIETGLGTRHYQTHARRVHELYELVAERPGRAPDGGAHRFEVAAGVLSDDQRKQLELDQQGGGDGGGAGPAAARRQLATRVKPIVGIIDYGCAFAHRQFEDALGTTRVLALWNQAASADTTRATAGRKPLQWRVPPGFRYGLETHRDTRWRAGDAALTLAEYIAQFKSASGDINERACYAECGYAAIQQVAATHGTHVMDLATGWPSPVRHIAALAVTEHARHDADIVFVQLPRVVNGQQVTGLLRANVLDAVRYVLDCALPGQPVVINLSYGGNVGAHDGGSVLERALDWRLQRRAAELNARVELVLPAGNAGQSNMHAVAELGAGASAEFVWNNLPDDASDSFVEFWFSRAVASEVSISVTPPGGVASAALRADGAPALGSSGSATPSTGGSEARLGDVAVLQGEQGVAAALVLPHRCMQSAGRAMALLAVARTRASAQRPRAPYGRWRIVLTNHAGAPLRVDAWCERDDPPFGSLALPRQSSFSATTSSRLEANNTLNSIAHGQRSTVVAGIYANGTGQRVPYSGRPDANSGRVLAEAASDESPQRPGLPGAAVYGTDSVRMAGTSQAAALKTRQLLDEVLTTWQASRAAAPSPHQ